MPEFSKVDLVRMHRSSRGLSDEQIDSLAEHCEVVDVVAGERVHESTMSVESLLLIVRGGLRLSFRSIQGDEVTVAYLGKDDQFGLFALTQVEPLPISVTAEEPSLILRLPGDVADQLFTEIPLWRHNLLQSLGPRLRESFLGDKHRKRQRFVVFVHPSGQTRELAIALIQRLMQLGEDIGLMSDDSTTIECGPTRRASLQGPDGRIKTSHDLRHQAGKWHDADRVILDGDLQVLGPYLTELMSASEAAYWFVPSGMEEEVAKEISQVLEASPGVDQKVALVHVLKRNEQVLPLSASTGKLCHRDFKIHVQGTSSDSYICSRQAGLERIVHAMRCVSVGLALGGGAARGMAHLGVFNVLENAGITIDQFSGTSAGSLTGVPYAAGYSADFLIESFTEDLTPGWLYRWMPYGDAVYMLRKFRSGAWDGMLRKYLHDWQLQQLPVPFSAVAVDLIAAEQVVRRRSDAVDAILESINLPGIARPICRDGRALTDGGVLNVVPADVLVGQGADFVIASDVASKIELTFGGNGADTPTEKMKRPSAMAGVVRTRVVQDRNIRAMGGDAADVLIEPDVSKIELTDFQHAGQIAEIGRAAATDALPRLRSALHELDPQLFPLS